MTARQGVGSVDGGESSAILTAATEFIQLLRQHVLKENRIQYPLALRALTASELSQMEAAFEEFEKRMAADGTGNRLRTVAERLTTAFAPDPERMAAAAAMRHCGPLGG